MVTLLVAFGAAFCCIGEELTTALSMQEIAEKAVRDAAERAAREKADAEAAAKATATEAAKATAEATVKAAVEKAAKEAAEAAAKAAAEAAAKQMTDEKAEQEKAEAKAKEMKDEQKEALRQIETRIFKLNHASAAEVAENLNTMWNGEFGQVWKVTKMAVAFPESNSVMVTAPRLILDACENAVSELDVEAPQVYIEARFVELGNRASHKIGIDWSMLGGMTGTATLGGGIQQYTVGKGVKEYKRELTGKNEKTTYNVEGGQGTDGSVTYFNGTLNFSQMSLTLKALDATEDMKMFSNPKIIVSSGKKAVVDMTTKYPNVQIATKKTFNTSGESVDLDMKMAAIPGEDKFLFAKEAFFSWGIELAVTPRIGTNGLINVTIVPTISELDTSQGDGGFVTANSGSSDGSSASSKYPIIGVKRLVTEFNMRSGATAVIGGLSRTVETQVDNGIPFLREIPWLGPRLFGSLERIKEQREIIVFVTVGLVDPHAIAQDAGLPKNAVLGRQYAKGQKLEPGDRPEKNMEGFDSLDMRLLEEQAKDPLMKNAPASPWDFGGLNPFTKDSNYQRPQGHIEKTKAK